LGLLARVGRIVKHLGQIQWKIFQSDPPDRVKRNDPLSEAYGRDLHQRMLDQTWKWAGIYRTTEKNIGIPHFQIRDSLGALLGDVRYWIEHQTFESDEIAIRFHLLVAIHPFANGNGRHARLIADVIVQRLGRPVFTWGGADIVQAGDFRRTYIEALRAAADRNDIQPLLAFARM
jgi:Fic-DOC domain mobile mystery protein B